MKKTLAALATISFLLTTPLSAQTATPEIPHMHLNDIAVVVPNGNSPTGAVIFYNPQICQQIGLACHFFRAHEHCHVLLGHQFQAGIHPMIRERDADYCAARYAGSQAVRTAWYLFMNGGSSSDWHTYGTPQERGRRLCAFAMQVGNWNGPVPCP